MNILLITADQWRSNYLSYLGHPVVKTPNLDSLAKEGVTFCNHFAQATPCAPSRVSLHTGMYMFNHRCTTNGTPTSSRYTNWAIETGKAGYTTSLFGYTDTSADPTGLDINDKRLTHYSEPLPGLDYFTPILDEVSEDWVHDLIAKNYAIPDRLWDLCGMREDGATWHEGGEKILPHAIPAEDSETWFMVDKCIDWIKNQKTSWVSHLSLLRPHPPFVAPAPYHNMYADSNLPTSRQKNTKSEQAELHPYLEYIMNNKSHHCPEDEKLLHERHVNYCGLVREVDDNLGRLFSYLRETNQWENTLIICTSDHGEQMGDHWLMGKSGFYDESYHIPLIIKDPTQAANGTRGVKFNHFSENIDIMPTMLDWIGHPIPTQCDGKSLLNAIRGESIPDNWRSAVHFEYDFRDIIDQSAEKKLQLHSDQCTLSVIRTDKYKYVHFAALPPLLFDLEKDPNEYVNVASDSSYATVMLECLQQLMSHRMQFNDRAFTHSTTTKQGLFTRPLH
jgi:arylsulfatase A-like enzyme